MSAFGSKAVEMIRGIRLAMSALPPKADKRIAMSALCQKRTFALQQISYSITPIGAGEQQGWYVAAESLRGLEVQEQHNFRGLLDRLGLTPAR
jgi:hypothetical protein